MSSRTNTISYRFRGAQLPPDVGNRDGTEWCKAITAAAGSPTVRAENGGAMELTLDDTDEVQNLCLYMGDVLPFSIDDILRVSFVAKITADLPAAVTATFGLASARNDDPDAIAAAALFKLAGNNSVLVETDDGVTNVDDIATGSSLIDSYRRCCIDFATGVHSQAPPAMSAGGQSSLLFSFDNGNGSLRRVARTQRFDMSGYSGNFQLFAQLQKTAAAAVATLSILEVTVDYRLPS